MSPSGWSAIVTVLALLACLLAGVWAMASSIGWGPGPIRRGARKAARHRQAACGRCGHAVESQATTCPECGTPYELGGMATPAMLARQGAPAWLAAVLLRFRRAWRRIMGHGRWHCILAGGVARVGRAGDGRAG